MSDPAKGSLGARLLILVYGGALVALGVQPVKKDAQETVAKVKVWVQENFARKPPSIKNPEEAPKESAPQEERAEGPLLRGRS
jgi:hypothetical protein